MRITLLLLVTLFSAATVHTRAQPKAIHKVEPVFPDEAKNYIYGGLVRLAVEIDVQGRVTSADAIGPLEPCADRNGLTFKAIRTAAVEAARATIYQAILDVNGKPVPARLNVTYILDPKGGDIRSNRDRIITSDRTLNYRALSLIKPLLTREPAVNIGIDEIMVETLLAEDGTVLSAHPEGGSPKQNAAATDAACQSKFRPAMLGGKPVKMRGVITYELPP